MVRRPSESIIESDGRQPASREKAPAEDERQARAEAPRPPLVAPVADHEWHRETRRGVHEHDEPDQPGLIVNPVEEDGEVRRRHRASGSGAEEIAADARLVPARDAIARVFGKSRGDVKPREIKDLWRELEKNRYSEHDQRSKQTSN